MALDPNFVASKWQRGLSGSAEQIRKGVAGVTTSPGESAIKAKAKYADGVNRALTNGDFDRGNRSYTTADWQQAMTEKGIPRLASGAQAALPKVQQFMAQWLPAMEDLSRQVSAMPSGSLEDSIARATMAIRYNSNLRGRYRSGRS